MPWCSPLSLRALFSVKAFQPDYAISQTDVSIVLFLPRLTTYLTSCLPVCTPLRNDSTLKRKEFALEGLNLVLLE